MSAPRTNHNPAGMKHEIILSPQARAQFHGLSAYNRAKIRNAIDLHLQHCPTAVSRSRIKRLRGLKKPQYRLRADELCVFYDVEEGVESFMGLSINPMLASVWLGKGNHHEAGRAYPIQRPPLPIYGRGDR
uniref:mRNA-degrading endonuclease RelE, toxin component of the RelBE toxin-antitoxin system n=1 Tax=Candidatus Kentrum sp. FW TaxID=2126338 RepID=A0A450TPF7_9GAMM|nr:MAG: mRNA-degrading endonuclease RelE, toxin component of the RelBE toxin-antitoxin system [Candidatus Kentron sp. FW]